MTDGFGRSLLASSAIVAMAVATPAHAQTKSFDVAAQPAQTGVAVFGKQADIQIVAARKHTQGKQTNSVRGAMSVEEGLRQLLAGTGLTFRATGGQTYMIVPLASGAAASGGAQAAQGSAVLIGSVRDHKTGAALKGARVEVVETGESTSTGDLGDFRFARLPTGDVTLRVSYLGFPEQSETVSVVGGLNNRTDIYLGAGATTEIVVYGQVSARAQALNQERTAENSTTVISGDLLGNFNGTTISDALRRAPGVAFVQDDRTGDGTNIIIRGLSPDYNQVKFNGIAVPEGSGVGRAPNLSNLLADSVSEIKISKTLLPSQESTGTGGLVEIETKSPLDRPKRYFNVSVDGTKRSEGFGHEYSASGTASFRFGAEENFGISASVQYRDQKIRSFNYNIFGVYGPYLPLLPNGDPATVSTLDPRTPFPFYEGSDYYVSQATVGSLNTRSKTKSITLGAEWQVSDGTNLRLDYLRSRRSDGTFQNTYRIASDSANYRLAPVPGLGGERRYVYFPRRLEAYPVFTVYIQPEKKETTDTISFRGETAIDRLTFKYGAGHARGGYSEPVSANFAMYDETGVQLTAAEIDPSLLNPVTGNYVTLYGPRRGNKIPTPLLASSVFERLAATPPPILSSYFAGVDQKGQSRNWSGDFSARYDFGPGLLKYIEAGLAYRRSSFANDPAGSESYAPVLDPSTGYPVPLDRVGIEFGPLPFSTQGADTIYRLPTRASVLRFIENLPQYAADGVLTYSPSAPDPIYNDVGTLEDQLVGYVQARVDIGRLEAIGGVRIERNRVIASSVNGTAVYDELGNLDLDYFNASRVIVAGRDTSMTYLPRLLVNFRPSEDIVMRAGYYSTVARPQVFQLNSERFISFYAERRYGPTNSQPALNVQAGNPGLKPARSHNFDLSAEWYDGKVGVIKLSAFYKRINNLLENNSISGVDRLDGIDLPDHPLLNPLPDDTFFQITYPVNNPKPATTWGIEAAVERRLTFLPGVLSGLGIYANYVFTKSKKTETRTWFGPVFDSSGAIVDYADQPYTREVPFAGAPRHSGTIGLTYSKSGFDGSLFYTAQGRRFQGVGNFGMDFYTEAVSSLDFRGVYQFKLAGSDLRLSFEALNILAGASDPTSSTSIGGVRGLPKYHIDGSFLGGRKLAVGLSATF